MISSNVCGVAHDNGRVDGKRKQALSTGEFWERTRMMAQGMETGNGVSSILRWARERKRLRASYSTRMHGWMGEVLQSNLILLTFRAKITQI
ncbi:hypothetical protein CEXT_745721 [Caerostris extrusa]|uniref:Uncharacterized protein n=1 Tax=Caerostris extrusa TaxID=172846 RepID=A0AAV4TIE5_CAEEX|nr:hypothetical protein CEXT_745721 [Caerostris extrusa]